MKIFISTIISIFLLSSINNYGQSDYLEKEVQYLSKHPIIDGHLDSNLVILENRDLPFIYKSDDSNPDVKVRYRIAYGVDFFYVYIEAEGEKLSYRDRAFQNGDGFQLVLAKPKPDNEPTDEFYVIGGSAVNKKSAEWTRSLICVYNVDKIFLETSNDTKVRFAGNGEKISFELMLPWKDVHPYHPWISEGIGFNLCFVKAIGDNNRNKYKALNDQLLAENSTRKYLNLKFQKPEHSAEPKTMLILDRNNINDNEILTATSVTISSESYQEDLFVETKTGDNNRLEYKRIKYDCEKRITINTSEVISNPLAAGGYKIMWRSVKHNSKGETYFTSLPEFSLESIDKKLEAIKNKISLSSFNTLKFKANELDRDLSKIKPYETCGNERMGISQLLLSIEKGQNFVDEIAKDKGFVRKAYRSDLDQTLLPYMIYIPEEYDPNKEYPLMVYLHGSSSDEGSLFRGRHLIPKGFIAICPNGRGPSNFYSWDNAQTDIKEAMDEIIRNYSIDTTNIFLSGFSMGGYGVYRTHFETPGKFKALAVFSGGPNLANEFYNGEDIHPDFAQEKYLKSFKNIPMFIFHGEADKNCSFESTRQIIDKLVKAGAKVSFVTEKDKGHEDPGKETLDKFYEWVEANRRKMK